MLIHASFANYSTSTKYSYQDTFIDVDGVLQKARDLKRSIQPDVVSFHHVL